MFPTSEALRLVDARSRREWLRIGGLGCLGLSLSDLLRARAASRLAPQPASFGRTFRFREGMSLNLRAEFTNIFNRAQMPNPSTALTTQTRNTAGAPTAGFGFVNTGGVAATSPRQGTIVGRFTF